MGCGLQMQSTSSVVLGCVGRQPAEFLKFSAFASEFGIPIDIGVQGRDLRYWIQAQFPLCARGAATS